MNDLDFSKYLSPIKNSWPRLEEATIGYLRKRFINLDVSVWEKICTRIMESSKFQPKVANFIDALKTVIHVSGLPSSEDCDTCGGKSLVRLWFWHTKDLKPLRALSPCPACVKDIQGAKHPDWQITTRQVAITRAGVTPSDDPDLSEEVKADLDMQRVRDPDYDTKFIKQLNSAYPGSSFDACTSAEDALKLSSLIFQKEPSKAIAGIGKMKIGKRVTPVVEEEEFYS